jgi:DNA-directed RNA polymerase subunit RPC12/RpoP
VSIYTCIVCPFDRVVPELPSYDKEEVTDTEEEQTSRYITCICRYQVLVKTVSYEPMLNIAIWNHVKHCHMGKCESLHREFKTLLHEKMQKHINTRNMK